MKVHKKLFLYICNFSLETTHNISKATELLNHSVERLARQIVKRKVSIANSFFNYVPKGKLQIPSTVMR